MRNNNFKKALIGVTSVTALSMALGINPAAAAPPPFTIDPNALTSSGGPFATVPNLGVFQGTSDSLIQQTGATTQVETGWVEGVTFQNTSGASVGSILTRMAEPGALGTPSTSVYDLYLLFTAHVTGVSSITSGLGTIAPGGFTATLYADLTSNDSFNAGATSSTGGTAPTVTNTAGDVVLAQVVSVTGDAGIDAATGAPRLDVVTEFILCDGTANQGKLGNQVITGGLATGCGTFNAATYFVSPVPFYSLAFASSQSASINDLTTGGTNPPNATLNGVTTNVEFLRQVPEPATLGMFGFALMGLGWFTRRRQKVA